MRAFADTKLAPGTAVAWLGYQLQDDDFDLLVEWMEGEDAALAGAATDWVLRYGNMHAKVEITLSSA